MRPQQPREEAHKAAGNEQSHPDKNDPWDPTSRHEFTIRTLSREPHTLSGMVVTLVHVWRQPGSAVGPPLSRTRAPTERG
jgi:hypothetical protein